MLADLTLERIAAPGIGLTITLPGVAPQGRLTWASRLPAATQVLYVLDDLAQSERGLGTFTPGAPSTITRDTVLANSAGTTVRLNFAMASTRCFCALPAAYLRSVLSQNTGRNIFHNGTFRIQQRGAGPFTVLGNNLDRWQSGTGTSGGTRSISAVALTDADRTAIGDEEAQFALQYTCAGGAAAGDFDVLRQRVESIRRTSNDFVTLSFWAKASAGTPKLGININQSFGTGGSPSGNVQSLATGATVTLSTTWQRYAVSIFVPSIAGKVFGTTIGTDENDVNIFLSSGATDNTGAGLIGVQSQTVQFWGMQLETGCIATPLERIALDVELANCMRFYQALTGLICQNFATAATLVYADISLPVTMRALPTVTFSGMLYSNASALVINAANVWGMRVQCTATTTGVAYAQFNAQLTAEL
jgi:hypothetical protein